MAKNKQETIKTNIKIDDVDYQYEDMTARATNNG